MVLIYLLSGNLKVLETSGFVQACNGIDLLLSGSLKFLEPSGLAQACNGVDLHFIWVPQSSGTLRACPGL